MEIAHHLWDEVLTGEEKERCVVQGTSQITSMGRTSSRLVLGNTGQPIRDGLASVIPWLEREYGGGQVDDVRFWVEEHSTSAATLQRAESPAQGISRRVGDLGEGCVVRSESSEDSLSSQPCPIFIMRSGDWQLSATSPWNSFPHHKTKT